MVRLFRYSTGLGFPLVLAAYRYATSRFLPSKSTNVRRTHPTLRCSPDRRARARTSFRLSLSDRKTVPSYALRCPPSTPGVKKRPPEPSPRPSGPRPT